MRDAPARSHKRLRMVSAWAAKAQVVSGQVRTQQKSKEITATPELLSVLELSGAIMMIDAIGCRKEIASQMPEHGADYVLSLKGSQGTLHRELVDFFDWVQW